MVDIQSPTAEIRRRKTEKKEEGRKIEITGQKYNGLAYSISGHNKRGANNCCLHFSAWLLTVFRAV